MCIRDSFSHVFRRERPWSLLHRSALAAGLLLRLRVARWHAPHSHEAATPTPTPGLLARGLPGDPGRRP
eukprot:9793525-Lingulodinium_polyedra.AAC.1